MFLLSPVLIGVIMAVAGQPIPENQNMNQSLPKIETLNVVEIHYYREGGICSGVLLKPWIVLTTGDCVYRRDNNKLFVKVRRRDKPMEGITVQVWSVTLDPEYKYGDKRNNLGLLVIYSQPEWDVGEFKLPQHHYTSDEIINKKLPTFVEEWTVIEKRVSLVTKSMPVTKDYNLCGASEDDNYWYCLDRQGDRHTYYKMDLGLPFFYQMGNQKLCLGIYTGVQLKEKVPGHLFQSIFPSISWISDFINEHPVGPL